MMGVRKLLLFISGLLTARFIFAIHTIKVNRKWEKQNWYVGAENDVTAVVDIQHDIVVLGLKTGLSSDLNFVEKIDGHDGNRLWEVSWAAGAARSVRGVCTDNNGDIIIVGSTNIDLYAPRSNNSVDIIIEKWNGTDGSAVWTTQFGSSGTDVGMAALALDNGQLYVSGSTTSDLFDTIDRLSDAFFVAEVNSTTGAILGGFQDSSTTTKVKHNAAATHLIADHDGHVFAIGSTSGLYGTNRDGSDAFALKFNASDRYGVDRWWGVQVDLKSSTDAVKSCDVDKKGDVYILGFSIVKLSKYTGQILWQRFSLHEGVYAFNSLVTIGGFLFLSGSYRPLPSTDNPSPTDDVGVGIISIESMNGRVIWTDHDHSSGNQEGLLIVGDKSDGNKIIVGTTDVNVTLPKSDSFLPNSNTDRKIWKLRIYEDPPAPITFGYEVDSRMVVVVLIFLCFLPLSLLCAFCHRDPSISFWMAFRRICLPVLDLITDILFLLTADFFSKELFTLCWIDLLVVNLVPVIFYEWAVYKNSPDYKRAVTAGGRYTPLLDVFCICSVDAKNFFKDYEANDSWPCEARGRRYPHPCNAIWTMLVMLVSATVAFIDLAVKFFFFQFKLLNYLFKSQHRYVKENRYLNQRAQNYEILTHVICQSMVQIFVQTVNGSLVKEGYTKIAMLSIAVSGVNIALALYWYVIRYFIFIAEGSVASFTNLNKVVVAEDDDVGLSA